MNCTEIQRRAHLYNSLAMLGFTADETDKLRRISNTLHNWHELECGAGEGQTTRSIERDTDGKPFYRVQFPTANGYRDYRTSTKDLETGALKRLDAIMAGHPTLGTYVQTDPRGAALYILRPGDVPAGADVSSYYSRGICVY